MSETALRYYKITLGYTLAEDRTLRNWQKHLRVRVSRRRFKQQIHRLLHTLHLS
ncbi:MAG: hypothetical protein WC730_01420 [Patescibacteria group bacterium]|jgi:hypothetical protein